MNMGILWRSRMTLLSTLAALVIIVHTADYNGDVGRKLLDSEPANYDQPWKAVSGEQIMERSPKTHDWEETPLEEAPKNRRPGRKRKRRPIAAINDEPDERIKYHEEQEERRFYHEEPNQRQVYQDQSIPNRETVYQNSFNAEIPKRRRKRPEMRPSRWTEEMTDVERPTRRRGLRRKRPNLTDFNTRSQDDIKIDNAPEVVHNQDLPFEMENGRNRNNDLKKDSDNEQTIPEMRYVITDVEQPKVESDERNVKGREDELEPVNENQSESSNDASVMSLKEILKKSNGSSLSEILQKHNLSLADLLHGKEKALSVLKNSEKLITANFETVPEYPALRPVEDINDKIKETKNDLSNVEVTTNDIPMEIIMSSETKLHDHIEEHENKTEDVSAQDAQNITLTEKPEEILVTTEKMPKIARRRIPSGRRKLRLRTPIRNNTVRFQATRDFMSMNTRRKLHESNMKPIKINNTDIENDSNSSDCTNITTITYDIPETTTSEHISTEIVTVTTSEDTTTNNPVTENYISSSSQRNKVVSTVMTTTNIGNKIELSESNTEPSFTETTERVITSTTVKPKPTTNSELRRQALTNRLRNKRLRHKTSTTEATPENINGILSMTNLISASEFVDKSQKPKAVKYDFTQDTTLEDFMVTEATNHVHKDDKSVSQTYPYSPITNGIYFPFTSTTEEIAKIEIEEVLHDHDSGPRLSKILEERNMSLSELVELRERGSSYVHLADIFHNTSREPNPPEPFLSKSVIEPISKETYPLRALLEANIHESTMKPTAMDSYQTNQQHTNIPIVMNFGNNVNENGENLGIVSLFNKMTNEFDDKPVVRKDSEGTPYITSIMSVNVTNHTESSRDARYLEDSQSMATLNDLFSIIHKSYFNDSSEPLPQYTKEFSAVFPTTKLPLENDIDGDGVIVLEDLQHLKDFDNHIARAADAKLAVNMADTDHELSSQSGILDKLPKGTKSVTVVTASIIGLTTSVFLLTYVIFKWRQQKSILRKKESFSEERIPTPVFESRKGSKNQCSTRSISPMLSSSHIYTMSTLDSRKSSESHEYAWDSLRKPFQ